MAHQSNLIAQDINAYLEQHENKELLRFLTCGSVDDGKSTLIGRLLHDSKMIFEDQLAAVTRDSKKSGTQGERIDLALLVDGLAAEREQGITIDVAYRYFSTDKRKFIIADTPGHEQYTRNMATGASTADLAIILVDARHGVAVQTKRHSYIANLLGIRHLVVAVNKMDLIDYDQARFEQIQQDYQQFANQLGLEQVHFIPMSAPEGDNVVNTSEHMPWYQGQTLMQLLESIEIHTGVQQQAFRLPVQYVNRPNLNFRGFCGTIASGRIRVGDTIRALPSGLSSKVKSIPTFDGELDEAFVGQSITLCLEDEIDISRGDLLVDDKHAPLISNNLTAELVWMHEQSLQPGKLYDIKLASNSASGSVSKIHYRTDVNSLLQSTTNELALNEIALVDISLNKAVAFDPYQENRQTGSFVIIDRLSNITVGAGMIRGKSEQKDDQVVSASERQARFGQTPLIVKVSNYNLGLQLERRLFNAGHAVVAVEEVAEQAAKVLKQAGLLVIVNQGSADLELSSQTVDQLMMELTSTKALA